MLDRNICLIKGFKEDLELDVVSSDADNIKKLYLGRIDLMLNDEFSIRSLTKHAGLNVNFYEKSLYLEDFKVRLYLAANKETSGIIIAKLRKAMSKVRENKTYDAILKRYVEHLR
ncbi:MAG: ABC transporter substrate-binding protein [Oligoflexia bacterium]|nr:ABC transporter substrate-binding protein [Oligoflexia bacterium]